MRGVGPCPCAQTIACEHEWLTFDDLRSPNTRRLVLILIEELFADACASPMCTCVAHKFPIDLNCK